MKEQNISVTIQRIFESSYWINDYILKSKSYEYWYYFSRRAEDLLKINKFELALLDCDRGLILEPTGDDGDFINYQIWIHRAHALLGLNQYD